MSAAASSTYAPSRGAAPRSTEPLGADPFETDPFDDFPATGFGPGIRSRLTLASNLVLRRRKPKLAYAAVVIVGVMAIVVTQLLLSVGLSNGAYQIESLQSQQKDVDRSNASLQEKLDNLSSPQNLAASAESLGMVSNSNPVYLRLSDGAVLGTPKPAAAGAGTFTGGQSSLVPNALTAAAAAPAAAAAAPAAATTPSAPPAAPADPTVAWQGDLPSPTTH
ncbi:hypothetical protein [Subtercola lobariae]|uniref:Cell division protein FtsL n=1 Tax=Subtercola lobariae TaxID=1588641 RepID=A0A917F0S3_9MICO|nr:hypothetical protein [Subtercola lobariae]GGF33466.1 hypothetical protein GCM10011399_28250 [Subtercola lobariae]